MKMKKWIALLLSAALLLACSPAAMPVRAQESGNEQPAEEAVSDLDLYSYGQYLAQHGGTVGHKPDQQIEIPAAGFRAVSSAEVAYLTDYAGKTGVLHWDQNGTELNWDFRVEETGWYQLQLDYCAVPGYNNEIIVDILLDGQAPFANVQNVNLCRLYLDETYISLEDNSFKTNLKGDELRPALTEQQLWQTQTITDAKDHYTGPMYFYLEEGDHTLGLRLDESAVVLSAMRLCNSQSYADYETVLSRWESTGAKDTTGYMGVYEAEKSFYKNALTLFATYDTAQVHVTPASPSQIYYNTIGKNTWKDIGQQITWEFDVPADGYYYLAFKVKQYDKSNSYSGRSISIDGEVLFDEMQVQKFSHNTKWYVQNLENEAGEALKVYLSAGHHVLGMTAIMDEEYATLLRQVDDVADALQHWYREIIKITGFNADSGRVTIDANRDFHLDTAIPGLMDGLKECRQTLNSCYEKIGNMKGLSTSSASVLKETVVMLDKLIKQPGKIAKRIETFRANISNISTWSIEQRSQPLVMDKFYVYSPDQPMPQVGGGFFRQIWYRFLMFLDSFKGSNTTVTGSADVGETTETIRVWISTADITTTGASSGRDQAIILKKLIDEKFTAQSGINVEVSLVGGSDTLVQAVLAGKGPDAVLFASVDTPVNLAMRDVALDLSQFEGYEEVLKEFTESAITPFRYKDGLYAFPETQNFNVLFYRADIFRELGLEPPKTWDEMYDQVVLLSNNNYMVGIPQNQNTFESFLYQAGTTFYTEDLSKSTFDTNEALESFGKWTDLYTKYSLPLIFDFFNRFRSGEMAMGIMPYNQVNYLYSAAPELDGLWDMAVIPGTVQPDGTINNLETCSSTGCIGLKNTQHPDAVYKFLSWWVSEDTQASFGIQLEQTLGIAARYATANLGAFEQLPWLTHQADVLRRQRANTVAVEQIPGSYYIARNLSFAFRAVVYNKANLRETLYKYNIEINKELERKQKEFNY